jgi:hypothetical protein
MFGKYFPRLSKEVMRLIDYIGKSFLHDDFTYLSIYGATISLQLLPKYVPYRLVFRDISYQMVLQDFNASLMKESN